MCTERQRGFFEKWKLKKICWKNWSLWKKINFLADPKISVKITISKNPSETPDKILLGSICENYAILCCIFFQLQHLAGFKVTKMTFWEKGLRRLCQFPKSLLFSECEYIFFLFFVFFSILWQRILSIIDDVFWDVFWNSKCCNSL